MAGKTSRTHDIVCWRCDCKFEVSVSLPKNAKKKGKVYSKWDSVRKCGECGASTRLRLSYTKKQGVYVDYEDPIKEEDEFEPCLLYTSPSPRDKRQSRMPSSA